MDVSFINHFISSTSNVFDTMLNCPIKRTSLELKEHSHPTYDVSAVIGLSGRVSGSVVLSMTTEVALKAAGEMMCASYDDVDAEVFDAIGELANMVAGGAKAKLADMQLSLGLPNVVVGRKCIYFPADVRPLCVGFETPWGAMALDVGFDTSIEGDVHSLDSEAVCV